VRVTGYRALTTVQSWGRSVGDANGAFPDGRLEVPLLLVDTDEGVTGVGIGSHVELDSVFPPSWARTRAASRPCTTGCCAHRSRPGTPGAVFGTIGASRHRALGHQGPARGEPLWRLLGGRDRTAPAYASGLDMGLTDDELAEVYRAYAERGVRAAKLKGGLDVEEDRRRLTLVRDVLAEAGGGTRPG
jgi:hypothetical protein